jgi:glucan 1,3-beta-glucosidase
MSSRPIRTYLVSSPIIAYYYTQLIGDAVVPPTLLTTPGFNGIAVIGLSSRGAEAISILNIINDQMPTHTSPMEAVHSGTRTRITCTSPLFLSEHVYLTMRHSFRSVRNLIIDVRPQPPQNAATGLHWQVSQGTSLINVVVQMSTQAGNNHQGIAWFYIKHCVGNSLDVRHLHGKRQRWFHGRYVRCQ